MKFTLFLLKIKNQNTQKCFRQYLHGNYEDLSIPVLSYLNLHKIKYQCIKNP